MNVGTVLDAAAVRLPIIQRWVGWGGVLLGPVLGMLHLVCAVRFAGYGQRVLAQYDAVQRGGDLLAAPAAQYFILLGFTLCLLWIVLVVMRVALAARGWWLGRSA
jgi:hypothetical protein